MNTSKINRVLSLLLLVFFIQGLFIAPSSIVFAQSQDVSGVEFGELEPTRGETACLRDENGERIGDSNPITCRLYDVLEFLTVGIGIAVTISVVFSGIQYTTSRGDPQKTAKAVTRITWAGIALALYVFGWTILNWLIPGGFLSDLGAIWTFL